MRIKIGFFTATHPEIDKELKRQFLCNVTLWEHTYNASEFAIAALKAKQSVDVDELEQEVKKRWPNCEYVAYTGQVQNKQAGSTWGRSFSSIGFEDLRRIQRGDLTIGEAVVAKRSKRSCTLLPAIPTATTKTPMAGSSSRNRCNP